MIVCGVFAVACLHSLPLTPRLRAWGMYIAISSCALSCKYHYINVNHGHLISSLVLTTNYYLFRY